MPERRASFVKTVLLSVVGLIILSGVLIQLIPYGRAHQNPPVIAEPRWDSPKTRELFMRSCGDCHSNETVWPWYSNIAPVSWLIQRDVDEGRAKLNVSEWGRAKNESDEVVKVVQNGSMPPPIYLPLHPSARLSDAERQTFLQGLAATFGNETQGERRTEHTGEGDND
ncbi:heme-binding domain-containing protein [Caldilinea sp.]|jgi:cytochrome c551/c552|uniref:heme-binding domain-containing protein n=1 Tax=Caldilinea sp. TaxID=2293560 RepID=UPI0021DEBD0A|nr:heme-binding domain-containing protein [Caldilinea sp.]GIV68042.1 MAG: cytochrome c [Caldilinea sp.]